MHIFHISTSKSDFNDKPQTPGSPCSPFPIIGVGEGSNFDTLLLKTLGSLVAGKRRVARNGRLCREGDKLGLLYVVRFGQFKAVADDSIGQQRVAGFHMAGDWMGLGAISTGRHNFGLIALDDSEVHEIPFAAAAKTMITHPQMHHRFLEIMSEALCGEAHHSMAVGNSLDSRFARFLVQMGAKYSLLGYSNISYRLSMTRADIGSYLGSTGESMSRVVARFNAEGFVTISGRNVEVHNWVALDAVSRGLQREAKQTAIH